MARICVATFIVITLCLFPGHKTNAQNFEWIKSAGGDTKVGSIYPGKIHVDAYGNTYVAGAFHNKVMFDDIEIVSSGVYHYGDIFIAKYDAKGKLLWLKKDGGTGNEYAQEIAVDAHGNIYILGFFSKIFDSNSCKIGDISLASKGNEHEYFLAKYDSKGNPIWVKQSYNSGHSIQTPGLMKLDKEGNIIIEGTFKGEMKIGDLTLKNDGKSYSLFLAKFSTDGNTLWASSQLSNFHTSGMVSGGQFTVAGLSTDAGGNIYYAGVFNGTMNIGGEQVESQGDDVFFVKLNSDGQRIWYKILGGRYYDTVTDLVVDNKNNPYLLLWTNELTIGGISNSKGFGSYVAKFKPNGDAYALNSIVENGYCKAMAVDNNNRVYAIGYFKPKARIDCVELRSKSSNEDTFIISQDAVGDLQWIKEIKGLFGIWGLDIKLDMANNVYGLGVFRGDATFENIEVLNIGGANAAGMGLLTEDMFITKINNINVYAPPPTIGLVCNITQTASALSSVTLSATARNVVSPATYKWDLGNGEIKTTSTPNLKYTYSKPGVYNVTVRVTDGAGCVELCNGTLTVEGGKHSFIVPNIFTPNGDQKNDTFNIADYTGDIPYQIKIFNRLGNQIAFIEDGRKGWDGSGSPSGTYYYMVIIDGVEVKGWVELVR
ncbi:gliding motility-associated-like protein [Pontibacter aydingkolensis]|uniref:Gliding motility-associated C-terminal domain-containing protein n=1 Tax=Pontibacter aydingkolensis TaxID=1911536 RepID=A0ABS7CQ33_9BACT|nr:gliding motility-associated C-terminal domain-containing protein [Pontibacter aydingkolensis]MBW7465934.1 gliding motility-associated C-terminal domain-containing protein [Pontibacter aydingkolensis]